RSSDLALRLSPRDSFRRRSELQHGNLGGGAAPRGAGAGRPAAQSRGRRTGGGVLAGDAGTREARGVRPLGAPGVLARRGIARPRSPHAATRFRHPSPRALLVAAHAGLAGSASEGGGGPVGGATRSVRLADPR